jgi:catechol 2,3-dioxygenase-like lactoylglutathione lyase family enzyme
MGGLPARTRLAQFANEERQASARQPGANARAAVERYETRMPVTVRYIVDDVDAAIAFYCDQLDFSEVMHPAPTFAMLSRGELRLVLSAPSNQAGGGQAMPDGTVPQPGGWNRFSLETDDLDGLVASLKQAGAHFRNEIVDGVGGRQILLDDPSGNPVELFEPKPR